jgi:glycosyltransferase involved in cell wall biosynthesis
MKKIVIINQSLNYLTVDIANVFAEYYENVVVISNYSNGITKLNQSIKHKHIIKYNRKSIPCRIFSWIIATIQIYFKLLKYKDYEILYVTNPPISYFVSYFIKQPFSILVYDIYPNALKNIGINEESFLYKWWAKQNEILFNRSKILFTLSTGMKNKLKEYMSETKIRIVPLWSDEKLLMPTSENRFIDKYNLKGKFIILYSGNMGYTHNVETIINIANKLRIHEDIIFVFIGDGGGKNKIVRLSRELHLTNCLFLSWQPDDMLPHSLSAADIGIVTINEKTESLSIPSKTFNLIAMGIPLLCIASQDSELKKLIIEHRNGGCFEKKQIEEMSQFILAIKNNNKLRTEISNAALKAKTNFSSKNALLFHQYLNN